MTFTSLDSMGKTNLMLDLISQRQRALGSNVANVDMFVVTLIFLHIWVL